MEPSANRHWLADQLQQLDRLAEATAAVRDGPDEAQARATRDTFIQAIQAFANAVASRSGVTACVVGHEGLVLAKGGSPPDAETLAAVSQVWTAAASRGVEQLKIGPMTQMVVVGGPSKVALFQTGDMTIAIMAPAGADLAHVMAE